MTKRPKEPSCSQVRVRRHPTKESAERVKWAMGQNGIDTSKLAVVGPCRWCDGYHLARKTS